MPTEVENAPNSMLDALVNMPNPPADDSPQGAPPAAPAAGQAPATIEEPEIKPLVEEEPEVTPEAAPKADDAPKPDDDEPPETLENQLRHSAPKKEQKAPETPAVEQKPADAKETTPEADAKAKRDADLPELGPHAHPKTSKVFRELKAKAQQARDERDAIPLKFKADLEALQKERDELKQKIETAPKAAIPKEIEEEIKTLRERVREVDIAKDPQIEAKYDAPRKQNDEAILGILKSHKFGFTKEKPDDPNSPLVENPQAIQNLVKSGLTHDNLQPLIAKLREAGLHGDARKLERHLDHNETLAEQKAREINEWKGNYESRKQMSEVQSRQAQESQAKAVREATEKHVSAVTDEIAKAFPQIKAPPAPLPTDQPAIAKAKQEALDAYNAAEAKVQAEIKTFDTSNVKPEEVPALIGRVTSAAIGFATLRNQVLPRVQRELAASASRIKELETELQSIKNAGKLSRLQQGGNDAPQGQPQAASLEDALKMAQPG